ncbi:MAG: PHP domain-containing protein [Bacilli bacterium]|nr:PHP domain-containing protein [Bacilli bacterium]
MKVDLHVHTNNSDGDLSIEEVLKLAKKNDLKEISITDHDTIIKLENFTELEQKYNLMIIPGIEIPTNIRGMHILGYCISNFNIIEQKLINLKKYNESCNVETIRILRKNGIDISFEQVKEITNFSTLTYRDIVKYLYYKGYVNNPHDAYRLYIGKGAVAYVPSKELSVKEVLNLISDSGGFSVLAHPFTLNNEFDYSNMIKMMKLEGLCGVEIYSKKVSREFYDFLVDLTRENELLKTVGTDFHNSKTDQLGVDVSDEFLLDFHEKIYKIGGLYGKSK